MWAVLYDDGTSLTTVSEPIARSLAEAERQRGHRVTVRRLDDDADSAPEPVRRAEPSARPEPVPAPEPARAPEPAQKVESAQAGEPAQAVEPARAGEPAPVSEPTREPEPARAPRPTRGRRLLLYALAAASIVVAAALADHWDALPRVGATSSSSPAQVSSPPRPQLLPPLDQPPVMHFSNAVRARSRGG